MNDRYEPRFLTTKLGHELQIIRNVVWYHWNRNAGPNRGLWTSLDIIVIDNKYWGTSVWKDATLIEKIDQDVIDKYPLPEGWGGKDLNINRLVYSETEFISTMKRGTVQSLKPILKKKD